MYCTETVYLCRALYCGSSEATAVFFKSREKKNDIYCIFVFSGPLNSALKVVTSEKIGGSGGTSTLGTWYGGVVMGVLLSSNEAAILYRDFNSAPS
jgi:hypothetical protein